MYDPAERPIRVNFKFFYVEFVYRFKTSTGVKGFQEIVKVINGG